MSHRWEPEHGKRHQQPGAVAHSLPEEAGASRRAVSDGSATPGHPCGRSPPAHHPDEMRRGLRLQGGVWGRTQPSPLQQRLQTQIKPGDRLITSPLSFLIGNVYQSNRRLHLCHGVWPHGSFSVSVCLSFSVCLLFCFAPHSTTVLFLPRCTFMINC